MTFKKSKYMLLLLVMALTGCASQGSLDNVRSDVDGLKSRVFTMDRDLASVREESKMSVGAVEKGFKEDVSAVRKMSADIQATIDSTKGEMQGLNGRVDDFGIAIKKQSDEFARYREDADKRLFALEERVLKQQVLLDSLSLKMADMGKVKKEDAEASLPADALYTKGLDLLKVAEVVTARESFTKFLELHPKHELAANAHYWIGETYYSEKNYESAILSYQEVVKNYPGKDKVVAAMLKQGMSFEALKDTKSAKYVYKKLIEGFPKSEEAKKARELLKEIK